jgi:hypothetical protein
MSDFINPKAMLTPGLAGATTSVVTSALVGQFGLPGSWVALAISFAIGSLVFIDKTLDIPRQVVYFVLNSLIIFSVAVGVNETGRIATRDPQLAACAERWAPPEGEPAPFFQSWF